MQQAIRDRDSLQAKTIKAGHKVQGAAQAFFGLAAAAAQGSSASPTPIQAMLLSTNSNLQQRGTAQQNNNQALQGTSGGSSIQLSPDDVKAYLRNNPDFLKNFKKQ